MASVILCFHVHVTGFIDEPVDQERVFPVVHECDRLKVIDLLPWVYADRQDMLDLQLVDKVEYPPLIASSLVVSFLNVMASYFFGFLSAR